MAMKKKFLGLAMAAMVAMPASSAYAWTASADGDTLTGNNTETMTQNVTVTGDIKSSQGTVAQGRLEVILPTTMAFSIDQSGNFTNVNYKVTNNSPEAISVGVQQFRKTKTTGGMILKNKDTSDSDMDNLTRDNVQMALVGDNNGGTTRYVDLGDSATQNLQTTKPLIDVESKQTGIIQLLGKAGKNTTSEPATLQNGITEQFTIVFEVKKKA